MGNKSAAVVVLNYNGKHLLERFLRVLCECSAPHEICVADNASSDGSAEYVRENFPHVKLILLDRNFGYAEGYNRAIAQVSAEYLVLINNDVEVTPLWLEPLIALMQSEPRAGACQPKLLDFERRGKFEYAGAAGGYIDRLGYPFCRGRIFNTLEEDRGQFSDRKEVFWASGACICVRRDALTKAGGLDNAYFAHMEEIDLCWRIRNCGYSVFMEPDSVVYHIGGGTLNKFSSRKTFLNFRNNLATLVKNHPSDTLVLKILLRLVLDAIAGTKFLLEGQPSHFFAVIHAHVAFYAWIPELLTERRRLRGIPGYTCKRSGMYKGSIVWEYFVVGKRKFGELVKGFY